MNIRIDGKIIRVNNDGSYDKRYKAGKPLAIREEKIKHKYNTITKKVNKNMARKRAKKTLQWHIFCMSMGFITGLFIWLCYKVFTPYKITGYVIPDTAPVIIETHEVKKVEQKPIYENYIVGEICNPRYKWNCEMAVKIATCESSLQKKVVANEPDGSISVGLFQINSVHFARFGEKGYIIDNNIEIAHTIWQEQGWTPWTCYDKVR